MLATYRFRRHASYGTRAIRLALALAATLPTACGGVAPPMPANVTVAARAPAGWPTPRAADAAAPPAILAARFSSLDVALGSKWSGEIVTSSNVRTVELHTTLYDIAATAVRPGDFRFGVDVYDLPTFLVRPYLLHVVARTASGEERELVVPFRIGGRPPSRTT